MNLKQRFSLIFSCLFSVLLASVMVAIYYMFSNFRHDEFKARLAMRGETTVKFLVGVKGIDVELLTLFDKNRANRLYNEKTTVFNDKLERLYTSNSSYTFNWTKADFDQISLKGQVYKERENYEVLGLRYQIGKKQYYVLTSAEYRHETAKMEYLKYLLVGAFFFGTVTVWILSFYLSKTSLKPLDHVREEILEITDKNLNKRLKVGNANDEINALSQSFNQMMDRIDKAYQRQKEFTGNASHELRSPIARITARLENIIQDPAVPRHFIKSLQSISGELYQFSDILTSLLVLTELNNIDSIAGGRTIRLDELIFDTAAHFSNSDPGFKFHFRIYNLPEKDINLAIVGDPTLLKIVFMNLFKNAYQYSDNKTVSCLVSAGLSVLKVDITNSGPLPDKNEIDLLFNTFVRGKNSTDTAGSGLGLSIVRRILHYHNASVSYSIDENLHNKLTISFPYNILSK